MGEMIERLDFSGKEKYSAVEATIHLNRYAMARPYVAGKRVLDVDRRDGVKLLLEGDAWVMMRPSGTEPLVRIYAEAATTDEVNELLDAAETVVTSL